MKLLALILILAAATALLVRLSGRRRQRLIESAFSDRPPLSAECFHDVYFRDLGIPAGITTGVRQVLEEQLGIDLSRLAATDDFTTNLHFLWELDSLADVEIICSLEERFGITITDDEAAAVRTIADLITLVHGKVGSPPAA